jgi:hypothetical protein
MLDRRLRTPWTALRLSYVAVPIIAGLDKFFNLLTDWRQYLSPVVVRALPFSETTFMQVVGVIEIGAGLLVLSRYSRLGSYVVSAWLVAIAANLISTGHYFDIAVRDLVLAVGAFTLGRLTQVKQAAYDSSEESQKRATPMRTGI